MVPALAVLQRLVYQSNGQTVISYRGTDDLLSLNAIDDA
jgi:hypothetical protein